MGSALFRSSLLLILLIGSKAGNSTKPKNISDFRDFSGKALGLYRSTVPLRVFCFEAFCPWCHMRIQCGSERFQASFSKGSLRGDGKCIYVLCHHSVTHCFYMEAKAKAEVKKAAESLCLLETCSYVCR